MSTKTTTKKPKQADVTALAAAAADRMFAAIATDIGALGLPMDDVAPELYRALEDRREDDWLPLLDLVQQHLGTEVVHRIEVAKYEDCEIYRDFGYLLGVEVGKRLAGGVR